VSFNQLSDVPEELLVIPCPSPIRAYASSTTLSFLASPRLSALPARAKDFCDSS